MFGHGDVLNRATVHAVPAAAVPAAEQQVNNVLDSHHRIRNPPPEISRPSPLSATVNTSGKILHILTLFTTAVTTVP